MKIVYNTQFCLNEQEVKQIIANWFEQTQGFKVSLQQILVEVEHRPYCEPEFNKIVIEAEREEEVDAV